jgi:hypothetical protein
MIRMQGSVGYKSAGSNRNDSELRRPGKRRYINDTVNWFLGRLTNATDTSTTP